MVMPSKTYYFVGERSITMELLNTCHRSAPSPADEQHSCIFQTPKANSISSMNNPYAAACLCTTYSKIRQVQDTITH